MLLSEKINKKKITLELRNKDNDLVKVKETTLYNILAGGALARFINLHVKINEDRSITINLNS